jgi:hypothetical protein
MEREASQSLTSMRQYKANDDYARTFRGRCYNVIGYAFAIYCAARILMCLPSIFIPPTKDNSGDWISYLIAFTLSSLPIEVDIAVWSRAISLAFTGLIILSSLAQVLRSLARILKLSSKNVGAGFLLLILAQLFVSLA